MITKEQVLSALSVVIDPDLQKDLVSLGMIEDIKIEGSKVSFTLVLTTPACPLRAQLERDARRAVQVMTGAQEVEIHTTSRVHNPKKVDISGNEFKHVIAIGSGKVALARVQYLNIAIDWHRTEPQSACWMPIFTDRTFPGCSELLERPRLRMEPR